MPADRQLSSDKSRRQLSSKQLLQLLLVPQQRHRGRPQTVEKRGGVTALVSPDYLVEIEAIAIR